MTQFYFSAVLAAITPVLTPSLGGFLTPLSAPVMTITSATVQVCDVVVMHSIPTPVVFEDLLISQEFKTCMFLLELQSYYLIDIIEEITVTGLCVCVCAGASVLFCKSVGFVFTLYITHDVGVLAEACNRQCIPYLPIVFFIP